MEQRNEPSTAEIVKALRVCFVKTMACSECPLESKDCGNIECVAADRLEQLERENAEKDVQIAALTARAEKAEAERDAVVRCSNCKHLKVALDDSLVYAVCGKYGFTFRSFDADTRETGCTSGERLSGKENDGKD